MSSIMMLICIGGFMVSNDVRSLIAAGLFSIAFSIDKFNNTYSKHFDD